MFKKNDKPKLAIHRIQPIDLDNPRIQAALERTRRSISNPLLADILKVRTAVQLYLCQKLAEAGFVHPPVYMLAGCTDPLSHWTYPARISYYGEELSITQSLILQKILLVMLSRAEKVFFASPNIRLEMRIDGREYKYVTEFMQVDFEQKNISCQQMMDFIGELVCGLYRHLSQQLGPVLLRLRKEPLPELNGRLQVFDAVEVMNRENLASHDEVERWLSARAGGKPFFLTNLEREAYDCYDEESGRFFNYDIIVPPFGNNPHPVEVLSGAERTRSLGKLEERMRKLGYPLEYFAPFFELFSELADSEEIRCAGAGFGVERFTYGLLGLSDIHAIYPFPRPAEGHIAL